MLAVANTLAAYADVTINSVTFPDATFRSFVLTKVRGASDGVLTNAEIQQITSLGANNLGIEDITGIEYLTSLKRFGCAGNKIKKIDISANKQLTFFDCNNNQLTELNVSNNTLLDTLNCHINQISSIDLSNNPNLKRFVVERNKLRELDLSHNTKLQDLRCGHNGIQKLNLDNNKQLEFLSCYYNSIKELDLSQHSNIHTLTIQGNLIEHLDISNLTELTYFHCGRNNLSELNLSENKKLNHFYCAENHIMQLKEPIGATFNSWVSDYNVSAANFSADQNILVGAELMEVNGEKKYVVTMPEDFEDRSTLTYSSGNITKTNNMNGKNGTFFLIDPTNKPNSFFYFYKYNDNVQFSVNVTVNYEIPGDANKDGIVDIIDINYIIDLILNK